MSHFLRLERERLEYAQKHVYEYCDINRKTYGRWEAGAPIPSDKLGQLLELGFDVQYVISGVRSMNVQDARKVKQEDRPHFEFEGKLSTIVRILEETLDAHNLVLPADAKGKIVEALLMQALLKKEMPTKENIIPMLRVVGL